MTSAETVILEGFKTCSHCNRLLPIDSFKNNENLCDKCVVKLDARSESNSVYYLVKEFELLSRLVNLTPSNSFTYLQELHSKSEFNSKNIKILGRILFEDSLRRHIAKSKCFNA